MDQHPIIPALNRVATGAALFAFVLLLICTYERLRG